MFNNYEQCVLDTHRQWFVAIIQSIDITEHGATETCGIGTVGGDIFNTCPQGNFWFPHASLATIGGGLVSYIGTRFAIKRGESFAEYAPAVGAFAGSVAMVA